MFFRASTILVCLFGVYLITSSGQHAEAQLDDSSFGSILKSAFVELTRIHKDTGDIIVESIEKLAESGLSPIKVANIATQLGINLVKQLNKILELANKVLESIRNLGNEPDAMASLVGDGSPSNSSLGQSLSSITDLVGKLIQSVDPLLKSGGVAASLVTKTVLPLVNVLLNTFGSLVGETLNAAGQLMSDGNESVVEPLIQLLNSVVGTSLSSVVNQIKTLSTNSSGLLDTVGGILNTTLTQVQSLIGQLTDDSSSTLRTALTDFSSTLTGLIETVSNQTQSG